VFGKTEHCTLNFLDTQRTHSVFASDWFRECGDFDQEQEEEQAEEEKLRPKRFEVLTAIAHQLELSKPAPQMAVNHQ
jgi:hypothetical protein